MSDDKISTLPTDIIQLLVARSPLGDVNTLARSCTVMANFVRTHAERLAAPHVRLHGICGKNPLLDIKSKILPNGTRHMETTVAGRTSLRMVIEYRLGELTYWQIKNQHNIYYGAAGSPYIVVANDMMLLGDNCEVWVGIGERLNSQSVSGKCNHIKAQWEISDIGPLRGFLIDGRIQPDVIAPWMRKIIELRDRAYAPVDWLTGKPHKRMLCDIFRPIEMRILVAEFGNEFTNL